MAAVMCALKYSGVFSGTVTSVNNNTVYFGPVGGLEYKKSINKKIKTYKQIPSIQLPIL